MKHFIYYIMCVLVGATALTGCIEDSISTSPSDQPRFEADTLSMGTVFTGEGTPTMRLKVFNPGSKVISIDRIALRDNGTDAQWRFNVDGISGKVFTDVEIRPNDSIFIFAEVTIPDMRGTELRSYVDHLDFTTRGVTQSVTLTAEGMDAERLHGVTLDADTHLTADRPYIVYDSLVVAQGATLTLEPGTRLLFHSDASLIVDGTLRSIGTAAQPVEMTGDRLGTVVGRVDYEIMSGQWQGVFFSSTSQANVMEYTSVRNTTWGVNVMETPYTDDVPSLSLFNCQLRNSKDFALLSLHSSVKAVGCELADASAGVVYLQGGRALISNSTIANYYLFTAVGPAVQFSHAFADEEGWDAESGLPMLVAEFHNCIIYGNGQDLSHGDLTGSQIFMRRCLFKSAGSDDENFLECIWGEDPLYFTVREDYHFDYRLKQGSPAIGAAAPELIPVDLTTDRYGISRNDLTLGAYSFDPTVSE
ncbi:MAG: hypothetical protein K2J06_00455 [Muribaculaceae bacterium]|nr:hypothetical protein [Muribaculaceae bacterium]